MEGDAMTDNWLQAAKERIAAATEGPGQGRAYECGDVLVSDEIEVGQFWKEDNAVFCSHARTDLPLALSLLAQAAEALEAVRHESQPVRWGWEKEEVAWTIHLATRRRTERIGRRCMLWQAVGVAGLPFGSGVLFGIYLPSVRPD
jgi:hypothetical protein